ncbi:hypothetical protein E2C01_060966 [Portunus trituberculatus]|uniref:Uncharacterized protein n=1 Tax=Portunus trituberculatus TaxID=210409 RepID=A0A5B7H9I2_PORTR|nr:hypothetical protein [Portunus trituberculatus]
MDHNSHRGYNNQTLIKQLCAHFIRQFVPKLQHAPAPRLPGVARRIPKAGLNTNLYRAELYPPDGIQSPAVNSKAEGHLPLACPLNNIVWNSLKDLTVFQSIGSSSLHVVNYLL